MLSLAERGGVRGRPLPGERAGSQQICKPTRARPRLRIPFPGERALVAPLGAGARPLPRVIPPLPAWPALHVPIGSSREIRIQAIFSLYLRLSPTRESRNQVCRLFIPLCKYCVSAGSFMEKIVEKDFFPHTGDEGVCACVRVRVRACVCVYVCVGSVLGVFVENALFCSASLSSDRGVCGNRSGWGWGGHRRVDGDPRSQC